MLSLLLINGFTTLITLINIIYLNHSLSVLRLSVKRKISRSHVSQGASPTKPRKKSYESNLSANISVINTNANIPSTLMPPRIPKRQSIQNHNNKKTFNASCNKTRVITYFKIVLLIPLFVSYVAFYCAIFPEQAIWILPFVNIVIGFVFLTYIKMLIISCDGWIVVRHYLETKRDICCSSTKNDHRRSHRRINQRNSKRNNTKSPRQESKDRCCMKSNGYKGLKYKIKLCYLILLKPMLNYATAYLQYYYSMNYISYILKGLTIITCIIPIQMMKTIHSMLKPYSKMSHTHIKMVIVVCLSPVCQLQQAFISLIFQLDIISETDKSIFMNKDLV